MLNPDEIPAEVAWPLAAVLVAVWLYAEWKADRR